MNYQQAIKSAIESIEFAPYSQRGGQQGVTEDIYWQDTRILKAGNPPDSHCVGAVGEAFIKALKILGFEERIPVDDIIYLQEHGFIYDLDSQFDGYPGAIVELGWGNFVTEEEAEYGDLAQYWHENHNGELKSGHAVIIIQRARHRRKDIFKNWSSTNLAKINGHGYDWHLLDKELRTGHERIWFIARPDIEKMLNLYS